jgi:hypothetical protein
MKLAPCLLRRALFLCVLAGTTAVLADMGPSDPPPAFDFAAYLAFLPAGGK